MSQNIFDKTADKRPGIVSYVRRTTIVSISIGVSDWNKQNYKLADSFAQRNIKGFSPLYFKVEHAITNDVGIALNLTWDHFYSAYSLGMNYKAPPTGGSPEVYNDNIIAIYAGLEAYYHFRKLIANPRLDVFVSLGANAGQINHSIQSTVRDKTENILTPTARIGARYYVDKNVALNAAIGYDRISLFNLGFSYRFW